MRLAVVIAFALAGAIGIGACTLFDEDPPDDSCKQDTDCFRAQGEVCNQETKRCEMRMVDAGVDSP